jgi:hypothetical protein
MVCADAVAGADSAAGADGEANALAAEVVDGCVKPGGVSGANPGVLDADDVNAGAVTVGAVTVRAEVEPAAGAITLVFSSGAALDSLRLDECPPRLEVPRPLAAVGPLPFEGSLRCANKPSKNARRGCDGAIC